MKHMKDVKGMKISPRRDSPKVFFMSFIFFMPFMLKALSISPCL